MQRTKRLLRPAILCTVLLILLATTPAYADFGAWSQTGPGSKVGGLAVDPTHLQIAYASARDGVWKTVNHGDSWSLLTTRVRLAAITVDFQQGDTLYALDESGREILKSSNGGSDWSVVYTGNGLNGLAVDPNNAGTVYAGQSHSSEAQVLRSSDGGTSWRVILDRETGWTIAPLVTGLTVLPGVPNLLYASITQYHGGDVLETQNATAMPPDWTSLGESAVVPLLSPSQVVGAGSRADYAVYSAWAIMGQGELLRHESYGSVAKLGNVLPLRASNTSSSVTALAVNPARPDWLYAAVQSTPAGQYGVFASADRGDSWTEMGHLSLPVHGLALDASSHTLYAATDRGLFRLMIRWPVAARFANFYRQHEGERLLGGALSAETVVTRTTAQYFEKGRIEDHSGETSNPNWRFMYGLLVDELQQAGVRLPVGGDVSSLTYLDIQNLADPARRVAPPAAYPGSGARTYAADGTTFVPFSADLRGARGHIVIGRFWRYLNRADLFPGGWLHDVGLPISEAQEANVTKVLPAGAVQRRIVVQAFQRTILTYDPLNPSDWQVERANSGSDYRIAFPGRVGP